MSPLIPTQISSCLSQAPRFLVLHPQNPGTDVPGSPGFRISREDPPAQSVVTYGNVIFRVMLQALVIEIMGGKGILRTYQSCTYQS